MTDLERFGIRALREGASFTVQVEHGDRISAQIGISGRI
jgi:hypothetical protein